MTHVWLRAEQREQESRVGLTHDGAKALIDAGVQLTVERSSSRVLGIQGYESAGATIAAENSWPNAPEDAIIFGLKELPADGTALPHKHILFGHAFKGQKSSKALLDRFKAGGGTLYDLEYLLNNEQRRVAAFGYWAGFAGAAVTVKAWIAQQNETPCASVGVYKNKQLMVDEIANEISKLEGELPRVIVIGALGRVGTGATDLCKRLGMQVSEWDIQQTQHGGPFPEIFRHELFLNCIVASEGVPQFVPHSAKTSPRALSVIGDIACDPDSDYNPIPVYEQVTTWQAPVVRVHDNPVLDVMAIDNLPSLLPLESSIDFSAQLLPSLLQLTDLDRGVWGNAKRLFNQHCQ